MVINTIVVDGENISFVGLVGKDGVAFPNPYDVNPIYNPYGGVMNIDRTNEKMKLIVGFFSSKSQYEAYMQTGSALPFMDAVIEFGRNGGTYNDFAWLNDTAYNINWWRGLEVQEPFVDNILTLKYLDTNYTIGQLFEKEAED
jgi:hypothetical protein